MKTIEFTEEELSVLMWAIENQQAKTCMIYLEKGIKPSDDELVQRLNAISKKAYSALVNQKKERP